MGRAVGLAEGNHVVPVLVPVLVPEVMEGADGWVPRVLVPAW